MSVTPSCSSDSLSQAVPTSRACCFLSPLEWWARQSLSSDGSGWGGQKHSRAEMKLFCGGSGHRADCVWLVGPRKLLSRISALTAGTDVCHPCLVSSGKDQPALAVQEFPKGPSLLWESRWAALALWALTCSVLNCSDIFWETCLSFYREISWGMLLWDFWVQISRVGIFHLSALRVVKFGAGGDLSLVLQILHFQLFSGCAEQALERGSCTPVVGPA